jgi:hypothetical protein
MSQYQTPFEQQTMDRPTTSGLAITSLVLSLTAIIPCLGLITGPLGVLLGLVSAVTIPSNPARKGTGLAVAAIIIGLVLSAGQGYGTYWFVGKARQVVSKIMAGPADALRAGFAGDVAAFRDDFYSPGAQPSVEEAQAFIDELRSRYGDFVSVSLPSQNQSYQPTPGETQIVMPYIVEFTNATMNAEVELVIVDETTRQFVMKWGYIKILDPERGDLRYPPAAEKAEKQPAGEEVTKPAEEAGGDGG